MKFPGTLVVVVVLLVARAGYGQGFGIELFNNVMPASGGMAGASIASPQDVQSAIKGNPASLTQFHGTQFGLSGVWIEPTINFTVGPPGLPAFNVTPFTDAKSDAQGVAAGNIGLTQDFSARGLPVTLGLGLMAGAGAGIDFRHVPESNGTHANIVALDIFTSAGVDVTDRLSAGASLMISNATLDGPFVGISGSSSDYALRGSVGLNYELHPETTVGAFWKTKVGYTFENLAGFTAGNFLDVAVERPEILGVGVSNTSLLDGRLLLAFDATYQQYTDTALFGAIYDDQWAFQFGAQLAVSDRARLRLGYAWNENPMRDLVGDSAGGIIPPGGALHVQYVQAMFAAIPQHRATVGMSVCNVLPGIDIDLFAGGVFEESQTFGVTTATLKSYWIGTGMTWHFGRGACEAGKW